MPVIIDLFPLGALGRTFVVWLRWPVLAVLAGIAIAAIYRYAPSRSTAGRRWVSWGTVSATILWMVGSLLFSVYFQVGVYVGRFPSYDETYSTLGAVMVLLMWLWISAFAVLLGGALDAEMELQARDDATTPPP
jgi:membrane protein